MKKDKELEKKKLRIEEKKANSFKFTKMEKRIPFFPTLQSKGNFHPLNPREDEYLDSREKF